MDSSITSTVVRALPTREGAGPGIGVDLAELQDELEQVAIEALDARMRGVNLGRAVHDERFPHLIEFHEGLRDALLVEIPKELQPWIAAIGGAASVSRLATSARYAASTFSSA